MGILSGEATLPFSFYISHFNGGQTQNGKNLLLVPLCKKIAEKLGGEFIQLNLSVQCYAFTLTGDFIHLRLIILPVLLHSAISYSSVFYWLPW